MNIKNDLGKFVLVGDSIGVIVGLPGEENVPEEHYAIWYGQQSNKNNLVPLSRTVPIEYCKIISENELYH